jgi:hypothetical protein
MPRIALSAVPFLAAALGLLPRLGEAGSLERVAFAEHLTTLTVPVPGPSTALPVIVLSPGPLLSNNPVGRYRVHLESDLGPIAGALVEIEVSPAADALVAWCQGQIHPIQTAFTDALGNADFVFLGGGCVLPEDVQESPYVVEVRTNGTVLVQPYLVSPDVVNGQGERAVASGGACETASSVVGLNDAVFHTRAIKPGQIERCTKITPPFDQPVAVLDAVYLSAYIKSGSRCACQ